MGGFTIGGVIVFSCTFYVAWECWLKEQIEEMIINWLCCGYGEQFMTCMGVLGFFPDWEGRKEKREDKIEFYGLSEDEIKVCKSARATNKLKYDESMKI